MKYLFIPYTIGCVSFMLVIQTATTQSLIKEINDSYTTRLAIKRIQNQTGEDASDAAISHAITYTYAPSLMEDIHGDNHE